MVKEKLVKEVSKNFMVKKELVKKLKRIFYKMK